MLDPRVYRAGLVPALLAAVVAAFSIEIPPRALPAGLPPDSFSGARALAEVQELAGAFPSRRPGSTGDRSLAARVARVMVAAKFQVKVRGFDARTAVGERRLHTVVGQRTGLSSRQIVVVAHRDALARPATADLSATAALIELARIFEGRTLRKTLVLVSTSGGSGGGAGATEAAEHLRGPVDAVLVLGDLAGRRVRRPVVLPWSNGDGVAPAALRRTVQSAVRQETGQPPGEAGPVGQFLRLAFPLTTGEQGEIGALGWPAVLLSASGERGPGDATAIDRQRLSGFGRAALRSITALDARVVAPRAPRAELYAAGKLLPGWAVRLLVATLILPGLLAAVDGFARMRRRGHPVAIWLVWVLASALPLVGALVFAYLLALVGLMPALPPAAAPVSAVPLGPAAIASTLIVALVAVVGWLTVRPLLLRTAGVPPDPDSPGAAAALALVLATTVTVAWVFNPFAAALLLPALHGWTLLTAPEVRVRRLAAAALVGLTLLPLAIAVLYYALALGASPLDVPWYSLALVVGGHVGLLGALSWCVLAACLASVVAILRAREFQPPAPAEPTIRGPLTYAGPGSLGGTRSTLRR